jgi:hypothetical protein
VTLHLIKLAVGIDDIDHLGRRQRQYRLRNGNFRMRTRMMPKRLDDLLDGGSLFWVIRRFIQVRQPIVAVREEPDEHGRAQCIVEVEPRHIEVAAQPCRPFQGWRYLKPEAAPPDARGAGGYVDPRMPPGLKLELRRLGLI